MEGSWRDVLAVLVILAQLTASGSSYQIIEGPQNVTVLKDSEAHFNCTVTHGWKLLMWTLNQMVVLSLTTQGPIITNNRFTYASYNSTDSFISELIIHDVQPSDSGSVQCSLQNSHGFGSAFLSVQDSIGEEGPALPTWAIILLAVAFSLLLILIIVLIIIFCCCCASRREKEESTYQNEIRKSANMRTNKADPETKLKSGKENYGYSSDEAKAAQTASLPPKSAEVSLPEKRSSSLPYQRSTHGMVDAERSKVHNNLKNQEGVDDMAAACGA
ncbi:immunoglobulin superfamily member 5 isoform X4 [Mus musculus]|uniref:immunoglobulin superfamily member 5 isoform X4 n=1 Tax=Mus musculus TaxID=10090 RepID=UPI000154CA74|nr:immunoglobulin superfamily member 5 isoform X4 [Mus musculus]EDL03675.1 junction adhesion molecule 4, isoform CRA_c [Mus musculus]|eukprot:XP_011244455.1 PREDICTED: immunoglobulin superfamily member 5 isoform X4 [Mus musculus]